MKTIFIHLHIPKCGGSTASDFLYRNLGRSLYSCNSILNDYQYTSEQINKIIGHYPGLKCLTGHKLSLNLPFDRDDINIKSICWVRDPVDRFVSHYFYHRNHTTLVPEAKILSLEDYICWALEDEHQKMYINGQVRFLSGGRLSIIQECINNGTLLLFPLSKLKESFYTLTINYPDYFFDWSVRTKNVSKKDYKITNNIRDRVMPFVKNDLVLMNLAMQTELAVPPANGMAVLPILKKWDQMLETIASCLRKTADWVERIKT